MEPKFQTSFIPKKSAEPSSNRAVREVDDTNIFTLAGTLVFLATVLLLGGLFLYKNLLVKQITQADSDINAARSAIEPEKIQEILDANSRITASVQLLESHLVTTELLVLLGDLAIKNLRFNDLSYQNKVGGPSIAMSGEVLTYNGLAFQQRALSENESIKQPVFSDIGLAEAGKIKFRFSARLDPKIVSYRKLIESMNTNQ